jgi:predicted acyl esterase
MNQWQVAPLKPPHLAAMCVWEGASDYYRELCRHGGILCDFLRSWWRRQVTSVQYGVGERGARSVITGELVGGPQTLSDAELARQRADVVEEALQRRAIDTYYQARIPRYEDISTPLLCAANWGGHGLHTRGNFEGYLRAGSQQKWLEVHGDTHFTHFYSRYGETLQKRFFGHFLKDENTGWDQQPRVSLNIRGPGERFVLRGENEWPLARTQWTKYYLHPRTRSLSRDGSQVAETLAYDTSGDGVTFLTPPTTSELEITGPVATKLWLSSATADADVFLVLRVFDADEREITFIGSNDPRVPLGLGWLRASHRKLDPQRSLPYRPYHSHDEEWPLRPHEPVELDIEIWPTSIVVPPDHRIGLSVRGRDYEYDGTDAGVANAPYPMKGVGPFTHTDREDRPPGIFSGTNTLHFGPGQQAYLLLPIIPQR